MATIEGNASVMNPADRRNNTFFRLTAYSLGVDNKGADAAITKIAIGKILLKDLNGNLITSGFTGVNSSSDDPIVSTDGVSNNRTIVEGGVGWVSENTGHPPWIEIALAGNRKISAYQIVAKQDTPPDDSCNDLVKWKLERLSPENAQWEIIDVKDIRTQRNFLTEVSGHDIPVHSFPETPAPTGYTPVLNYDGQIPFKPIGLRATSISKSEVVLKWSSTSDPRATTYKIYRGEVGKQPILISTVAPIYLSTNLRVG
ncbi:hypothetical protein CCP3SC1_720020 [Gammaproteobacteria bacterium]